MKTKPKAPPAVTGKAILGTAVDSRKSVGGLPSSGATKCSRRNHRWARHLNALLAMRERILESQRGLRDSSSQPLEPHSMDLADSATDEFDHEMALGLASSQQETVVEIDDAIARIENGTYGICEATGKTISESRLEAIPWTRFTVEAESEIDKAGQKCRPRLGALGSVRAEVTGNLEEIETDAEPEEENEKEMTGFRTRGIA